MKPATATNCRTPCSTWLGGIDYLKYDWCSASQVYDTTPENGRATMEAAYAKMGAALLEATKNSPRKIVYSLCQYGNNNVGEWGAKVGGNLWRTTGDINDSWQSMSNLGFNMQVGREKFAGPGHWNDPDMLEIGNGHMTDTEYQTHMSLWSLLRRRCWPATTLRDMKPSILEILTNKEVIAVDQDKLGKQAVRVFPPVPASENDSVSKSGRGGSTTGGTMQVFTRPLADGSHAVGLFNLGATTAKVTAKWSDLGIKGSHKVRDLWKHADLGAFKDEFSADVPSHGVVMIKIAKVIPEAGDQGPGVGGQDQSRGYWQLGAAAAVARRIPGPWPPPLAPAPGPDLCQSISSAASAALSRTPLNTCSGKPWCTRSAERFSPSPRSIQAAYGSRSSARPRSSPNWWSAPALFPPRISLARTGSAWKPRTRSAPPNSSSACGRPTI